MSRRWWRPAAAAPLARAAGAAVVMQGAQRDEHAEPEEPRLVEQEVPQDQCAFVESCPAGEVECDDAEQVQRSGVCDRPTSAGSEVRWLVVVIG
jgi:hypothetical protein